MTSNPETQKARSYGKLSLTLAIVLYTVSMFMGCMHQGELQKENLGQGPNLHLSSIGLAVTLMGWCALLPFSWGNIGVLQSLSAIGWLANPLGALALIRAKNHTSSYRLAKWAVIIASASICLIILQDSIVKDKYLVWHLEAGAWVWYGAMVALFIWARSRKDKQF